MTLLKIIISDTVLLALITSITAILTLWINHRLGKVHQQINSRMDQLLQLSKDEANAQGKLAGKAEEKAEQVVNNPHVSESNIEGKIEGVIKPKSK